MCLAVPVIVVSVTGNKGEVDVDGVSRAVNLILTPEAKVGDYVLLHAGFAISVVDEEEALKTLQIFREMAGDIETG